ncbi:hypothetical protein GQ42DRAFT_164425 [Ramicandelaber brevisporus]|nr:hypothetical protein GQ42DRAFT_164425 [Ramicandelaber brevisporus]
MNSELYDFEDDFVAADVDVPTDAINAANLEDDDLDLSEQQQQQQLAAAAQAAIAAIPDGVKKFLIRFHAHVTTAGHAADVQTDYDFHFNKLTNRFYQKAAWPEPLTVASLVQEEATSIFIILYSELYYRHIYSRLQPTLEERVLSYENYCMLFNYILNSGEKPVSLELPTQWLWDIIDEFIYQFQNYSTYRSKLHKKTLEEITVLKNGLNIWGTYDVLNVLYSLVQKSNIRQQLSLDESELTEEAVGVFGICPLYRTLGYFSLLGLLRVHTLLGDYTMALKTMEGVELYKKTSFPRVIAGHVSTFYHIGICYMMLRRYSDASRTFQHVLKFIAGTKHFQTRASYQFDQVARTADRIYQLLALCFALVPTRLDEATHATMREKCGDQFAKLHRPEEALGAFEALFSKATPRFINPVPPNYDEYEALLKERQAEEEAAGAAAEGAESDDEDGEKKASGKKRAIHIKQADPSQLQYKVFVNEVRNQLVSAGARPSPLDSEIAVVIDPDFAIENGVIKVAENKAPRRFGEWFIRNSTKFAEMSASLQSA